MSKPVTISACLVIYNEEKIIERCLSSIKGLADEIIIIHDGPCTDRTLEIAKQYTDKIFVREHQCVVEGHLAFAFAQATCEWLLRFDADEYFDVADHGKIRALLGSDDNVNGYIFDWEFWDGKRAIAFAGIQKPLFFRRKNYRYVGVVQEVGEVDGGLKKANLILHHRPNYNNISWKETMRKANYWIPALAKGFFPELFTYECYNTTPDKWIKHAMKIRKHPLYYIITYPPKTTLAQLKNGLWKHGVNGWSLALQNFVCYFSLYYQIWQIDRSLKKKAAGGAA
ncbi:MAG: glycosyltransferase [Patescibacteria group bacterium]